MAYLKNIDFCLYLFINIFTCILLTILKTSEGFQTFILTFLFVEIPSILLFILFIARVRILNKKKWIFLSFLWFWSILICMFRQGELSYYFNLSSIVCSIFITIRIITNKESE